MKKILIDSRHGLGDLVQSIPFIRSISNSKKYKITVLVKSNIHKELLISSKINNLNIEVLDSSSYSLKTLKTVISLFLNKFDIFFISPISEKNKSIALGKLLRIPSIFVQANEEFKGAASISFSKNEHMIDRNLLYLSELNLTSNYNIPYIYPSNSFEGNVEKLDIESYFVLAIGGNPLLYNIKGTMMTLDIKQYPLEKYMKIVNYFSNRHFVVLGGVKELDELTEFFKVNNKPDNLLDLTNKTSITETIDIIKGSRIVIGGDTGLIHIAEGLGVNTISLFGPTNPERHAPRSSKAKVISSYDLEDEDIINSMNRIEYKEIIALIEESINE